MLHNKEYLRPVDHTINIQAAVRSKKEEEVSLRERLSLQVRDEFPDASTETLNAIVTRRIYEQQLKAGVPEDPELTLKPDMSKTLKRVQERVSYHNGKFEASKFDKGKDGKPKMVWSCCQSSDRESSGCVVKVVDKQKWTLSSC